MVRTAASPFGLETGLFSGNSLLNSRLLERHS
jgi:hypothetical protein